jgi:hypothetical protein
MSEIGKPVFHTEFVGMFAIYAHTKFHMSSSSGTWVIAIKPKANYRFRAVAMLLFCILQEIILKNLHIFARSIITNVHDTALSDARNLYVRTAVVLVLLIVGN